MNSISAGNANTVLISCDSRHLPFMADSLLLALALSGMNPSVYCCRSELVENFLLKRRRPSLIRDGLFCFMVFRDS